MVPATGARFSVRPVQYRVGARSDVRASFYRQHCDLAGLALGVLPDGATGHSVGIDLVESVLPAAVSPAHNSRGKRLPGRVPPNAGRLSRWHTLARPPRPQTDVGSGGG